MANTEWDIPFTLKSPVGSIDLNAESGYRYLLVPEKCSMQVDHLRVTTDDVPAGDGGIARKTWESYYTCSLGIQYWIGEGVASSVIACAGDRRKMHDDLMAHLYALIRPDIADLDAGNCQLFWTPSMTEDEIDGSEGTLDDRLLHRITLVNYSAADDGEGAFEIQVEFRTELPYVLDKTLLTETQGGAATFTLTNPGTSAMWPVFRVHASSDVDSFELSNIGSGLGFGTADYGLFWDGGQLGVEPLPAGEYIEIDSFHNTMYRSDGANQEAGLDIEVSEFWPLFPGDNDLRFIAPGGTLEVFWQGAWF